MLIFDWAMEQICLYTSNIKFTLAENINARTYQT